VAKCTPAAKAPAADATKPKSADEIAAEKKERQERMAKAKADREAAKANKQLSKLEEI
jgi:hypothetical protein